MWLPNDWVTVFVGKGVERGWATERFVNRLTAAAGSVFCLALAGIAGRSALFHRGADANQSLPPGLRPDRGTHDFSTVGQQETLTTRFRLTNQFASVVTIDDIDHGCACSNATVDPSTLQPGQTADVEVAWKTGGRRGAIQEALRVRYAVGDGPLRVRTLLLKATVEPDVEADPPEVEFVADRPAERVVRFTSRQATGIGLKMVACPTGLTATVNDPPTSLTVRWTPTAAHDPNAELHLVVGTTSPKQPWFQLPVRLTPPTVGPRASEPSPRPTGGF